MTESKGSIRCTLCAFEVSKEEADEKNLSACPNCGTTGVPCDPANDVEVKLNWQELSVLSIWAERWALQGDGKREEGDTSPSMAALVYAIVERLERQHPEQAKEVPLTLAGQLGQVRDRYRNMKTNFPGIEGATDDDS